ncbi:OmpA family protein [Vineibacter terrae]|uniref:OmpA family protein n=1 Tax=Vineibacter terrae TaxID=2586908 RepID=A0A5C8PGB7_9HYPH|nr:OmpA family protein [Vineibacter terrae]TXL72720.1 OmpA family protein [Vineibacter terrae]
MKAKLGAVVAAALVAVPLAANAQSTNLPGFYVGVEGGLNWLDLRTFSGADEKLGFAAGAVVGYDFVGPRVELEPVYRYNKVSGLKMHQYSAFANVLYDFMTDSIISPHLGIGAGINYWKIKGTGISTTDFAMQGIAGVSLKISDGFYGSLDYKFMNTFAKGKDFQNHTAMLTLGYKFGPPTPAAPPPPPPGATPAQYIVFFDFDRATLTAQAMTTIKQAADAAKAGNKTRIGVTGHTDRSGGDAYNMALSLRRANAVKDALVREGIPASGITVVGRGESQPLVPTADGVREPQNRRVEIVLQ